MHMQVSMGQSKFDTITYKLKHWYKISMEGDANKEEKSNKGKIMTSKRRKEKG